MIAITVEDISLSFGTKSILENITFSLDESDRLGIIGVNGCGKSTLFKIISGELTQDGGAIRISKDKSVGILRQDDAFRDFSDEEKSRSALDAMLHAFPELLRMEKQLAELEERLKQNVNDENAAHAYTALNERFIASGGLEFRGRCASTLLKLGFDKEMQERCVNDFSGGQRTRLALARELCREPDVLMLDEPTNHLDTETLTWLENHLSGYKKCLLVVSHDRYFLDRVTNKTLCIENRKAKLYNGGYTKSMEQRKTDLEIEWRHYKNQQKEIARQEAYIAQQRAWNRERNIIAAESRLKLLDKMEKLDRPENAPKGIRMKFSEAIASGNDVLRLNALSFAYEGGKKLIDNMSFTVKRGDRLFLVGHNGCGKSTLIKLFMGSLFPTGGYIEHGYNVKMGYYDQENQNLTPLNTVLDELWNDYRTLDEVEIRNTLALFRFVGDDVFKLVRELSGGERARLTLAKLMLKDTNLLVLDEPTNHLDINSREALEEALQEYDGTVVIVSHDRYLIEKLATRLIDMTPTQGGADFTDVTILNVGEGYSELMRNRERRVSTQSVASAQVPTMSAAKETYLKNKKETADKRNAQKRLERLKKEAEAIEQELDEIDALMNGEAATDYTRLSELDERKNVLEERLLEIYGEI